MVKENQKAIQNIKIELACVLVDIVKSIFKVIKSRKVTFQEQEMIFKNSYCAGQMRLEE